MNKTVFHSSALTAALTLLLPAWCIHSTLLLCSGCVVLEVAHITWDGGQGKNKFKPLQKPNFSPLPPANSRGPSCSHPTHSKALGTHKGPTRCPALTQPVAVLLAVRATHTHCPQLCHSTQVDVPSCSIRQPESSHCEPFSKFNKRKSTAWKKGKKVHSSERCCNPAGCHGDVMTCSHGNIPSVQHSVMGARWRAQLHSSRAGKWG